MSKTLRVGNPRGHGYAGSSLVCVRYARDLDEALRILAKEKQSRKRIKRRKVKMPHYSIQD